MNEQINANRELWQKLTEVNAASSFYRLEEFKKGENKLNPLELGEVGPVTGKSLLHLQCHFGMDTLSWARLGAKVTGMDFSPLAIELAQSLARELNLSAEFICCNLYDLPTHLQGQFDIVYTSYGVLAWLPDVTRWAEIAASYVKPGGIFYIAEFHPFATIFDESTDDFIINFPYFQKDPFLEVAEESYTEDGNKFDPIESFEWNHPLGEVVSALIGVGLQIEFLHEFPYSVYRQLKMLKETPDHIYTFPDGEAPFPLMYSIRAKKPG